MVTGRSKAETLRTSNRQASREPLKNISKAARDEVHVAVAQSTAMSGAEMRDGLGALENFGAEQTWTSRQVT